MRVPPTTNMLLMMPRAPLQTRLAVSGGRTPPVVAKKATYTASEIDGWAHPCELDTEWLFQHTLAYDTEHFDLVGAAEAVLGSKHLGQLHHDPLIAPEQTPPALRRGQIQARVGARVSKLERKGARTHAWRHERTPEYRHFLEVYRRLIFEWAVPQLGGQPLLYQRKPILRVVLPGSVAPTQMHCDADYWHDANELNYWVPLSRVWGGNSLWSESTPGAGDFAAFEAGPGEAIRFYGNRCRHYTTENDTDGTRVSIDFRVIPARLFRPPTAQAAAKSKHALDPGTSKRGYYALADPGGSSGAGEPSDRDATERSVSVGTLRRAWRVNAAGIDAVTGRL